MLGSDYGIAHVPNGFCARRRTGRLIQCYGRHRMLLVPRFSVPKRDTTFMQTFQRSVRDGTKVGVLGLLVSRIYRIFRMPCLRVNASRMTFAGPRFTPRVMACVQTGNGGIVS